MTVGCFRVFFCSRTPHVQSKFARFRNMRAYTPSPNDNWQVAYVARSPTGPYFTGMCCSTLPHIPANALQCCLEGKMPQVSPASHVKTCVALYSQEQDDRSPPTDGFELILPRISAEKRE